MASIPAPKNTFLSIVRSVLESLIEGAGVDVAVSAATTEAPWLGLPIIKAIFRFLVGQLAVMVTENLFNFTAKGIIRIQNDGRKEEFDKAMEPIQKPGATPDDIKRAKDAIDRLVNRNRP